MSNHSLRAILLTAALAATVGSPQPVLALQPGDISQTPLFVGADVPGNLVFVPSVEWPTINSVANLEQTYTTTQAFVGYFDSDKCYVYNHDSDAEGLHFAPVGVSAGRRCTATGQWSGNFLNWAATQTVDPFRKVLTGGYRVVDTPTTTWLEKGHHDGQGGTGIYPNRTLSGTNLIEGATPFSTDNLHIRIQGLGNQMRVNPGGTSLGSGIAYDPAIHPLMNDDAPPAPTNQAYDLAVRVSVCNSGLLESNCVSYSQGYKPEGVIQGARSRLRMSVFGYLNDSDPLRDGGVLRARQKFVSPSLPDGSNNPRREWDANTGVFIRNPDAADASATSTNFNVSINDSGVINYINKFGQLRSGLSGYQHKNFDPVSELYYAAVRYIRGESNVGAWSSMAGAGTDTREQWADGFPVITDWQAEDPLLYACSVNVALGIGDIYTHRDKNLPGSTATGGEPTIPAPVAADDWINVVTATNRVGAMEGIGNIGNGGQFTGRSNSAFMAGLAYWANTMDMRPDTSEKVTMSTHWVDVLEAQSLEGMARNQFALAAKYGGASVPDDFNPMTDSLSLDWWHTNGETLTPFGARGVGQPAFQRPDNFYIAGNAAQMVDSLNQAFGNIIAESSTVVTTVATTSTRLETDTIILEGGFESATWSGEVTARNPFDQSEVLWRASTGLQGERGNIYTYAGNTGQSFLSGNSLVTDLVVQGAAGQNTGDLMRFLRGDRSNEDGINFRVRGDTVLGDIVNANIVFSGPSNEGWARLGEGPGVAYLDYIDGIKQNRGGWVFAGANDGMLHAFDATNGAEAFTYIPGRVLTKVGALADPDYTHQFFVDGGITVSDAFIDGQWRTMLVGTLGAGGRGVFALDVTNPASFGTPNVRWEFTDEDDSRLGFTFGKPVITRLANGTWVAMFGNGYASDAGGAHLFVVNLATGAPIEVIDLDDSGGNGLSGPTVWMDQVSRTSARRAYAGDLKGNMWRVDFDESGGGLIPDGYENALFSDPNQRPISVNPTLAASPTGGLMVYFGTGKLVENADRFSNDLETFWAVRDRSSAIANTSGFSAVTIGAGATPGTRAISSVGSGVDGWFLPLQLGGDLRGEKVLESARVLFGRLIFSTFEAVDDVCIGGGIQRLYVLDAIDGGGQFGTPDCPECGAVDIGVGPPLTPPLVVRPVQPPGEGGPGAPGIPGEPGDPEIPDPPGSDAIGDPTDWCAEFGIPSADAPGGFLPFGRICEGRQSWRQSR